MLNRRNASYLSAIPLLLAAVQAASADVNPGNLNYVLSSTPLFQLQGGATQFTFGPGNGSRTTAYGSSGDGFTYYATNYGTGVVGEHLRNDSTGIVFNSSGMVAVVNQATSPTTVLQTYLANGTAIGPTGAEYTFSGSIYNQAFSAAPNAGYVLGFANRTGQIAAVGTFGNDAWAYVPSTGASIVVGPTGGNYDDVYTTRYNATTGAGTYRFAEPVDINDNGIATGYTDMNYTSNTTIAANGSSLVALGRSAWVEDTTAATPAPVIVGFTGTGYTWNATFTPTIGPNPGVPVNYTSSSSTIEGINDAGTAIGSSLRYSSSYNPTITTLNLATASDAGQDAWLYTSSLGTVQIGLTGNIYTDDQGKGTQGYLQKSLVYQINSSSQIAGYSLIYANSALANGSGSPGGTTTASLGQDAWVYTPNTSGGGVVTSAGTANAFGTTAAGTYTQVGLISSNDGSAYSPSVIPASSTTAGYVSSTGARSSFIVAFNNLGQAAGDSTRYFNTSTTNFGQDAWFFNGTTTTLISPVSPTPGISYYFTNASTGLPSAISGVSLMTDSGLVGGWTYRYLAGGTSSTNDGQDAWVYDSTHNNGDGTFGKLFTITAPSASTAYEKLTLTYISNSGIALGTYSTSTGSTATNSFPFVWTESGGYESLTSILTTDLGTAGWSSLLPPGTQLQEISALYVDPSGNIYGWGTTSSGAQALYKLTSSIPGDANNDGIVGLSDLAIVLNNFGSTTSLWTNGNFDGASTIDLTDLADVLNNFGSGSSPSAVGDAVPEPTSLGLLAVGSVLLLRRRK